MSESIFGTLPVARMPADWDDHEGWNRYYSDYPKSGEPHVAFTDLLDLASIGACLQHLRSRRCNKIWLPGCGASLLTGLSAASGFRVWASDVSPVAIEIQQSRPAFEQWVPALLRQTGNEELLTLTDGRLGEQHFDVHDFRTPFSEGDFDCILNVKAFQGLPSGSMQRAAKVHWDALKPGGYAYFFTMNVQGEYRNIIEESLLGAGFYVPYHATERWYRAALAETGVDYVFILGRPVVRADFGGFLGKLKYKRNQKKLARFQAEYERRLEQETPQTQAVLSDAESKVAYVVYNTG